MRPATTALRKAIGRFGRDESGSMIVFSMFILIMMLMVGGMAVDLMRYETARTRLQATLDRAVLAAADLDQTVDAETVVEDYFAKAGLLEELTSITVTETINSRSVAATAEMGLDTFFMDMLGVETLQAPAAGTAIESVSDIEIVLVLDVSGSMGSNSRLVNLRAAARDFVDIVRENDDENRISIAIVPFNAQVNLGETLFNQYNATNRHGVVGSWCLDLPSSTYAAPGLSTTLALPQSGYFDSVQTSTQNTSFVTLQAMSTGNLTCRIEAANIVRLPQQNVATLQSQISALTANGNTSITLGMKWGLAMIDPGSRAMFTALIGAGQMPATLAGRPYAYDREDTLKVIVLMTDGEHVASTFLDPGYRTEISPIYRASGGDRGYSIFHASRPGTDKYWVPSQSAWQSGPWRGIAGGTGAAPQLNWNEVWSVVSMRWVAWQLYARALGTTSSTRTSTFNTWMANFTSSTVVATMNSTLQQSCAQARANNVVVFGIAFEAPANGQTQIYNCSSSPSHYYNANGLEIRTAFRAIASQINSLRLVQ